MMIRMFYIFVNKNRETTLVTLVQNRSSSESNNVDHP